MSNSRTALRAKKNKIATQILPVLCSQSGKRVLFDTTILAKALILEYKETKISRLKHLWKESLLGSKQTIN